MDPSGESRRCRGCSGEQRQRSVGVAGAAEADAVAVLRFAEVPRDLRGP